MRAVTGLLGTTLSLLILASPCVVLGQATPDIPPPPPSTKDEAKVDKGDRGQVPPPTTVDAKPAPKSKPANEKAPAKASDDAGQKRKSKNLRLAPTPDGDTGLLRVGAADGPTQGTIRIGLGLDVFSGGGFITPNDSVSRFGAVLSLSAAPLDYLEAWFNWRAISTESDQTDPNLLQSLGDIAIGVKGHYPVTKYLGVGADLEWNILTGIGAKGFDASIVNLRALSTLDLQEVADVPIRAHLNLGAALDFSNKLVTEPLTVSERYAFGISDFHRFIAGLAVEVPLPYVTPYMEYTIEVPLDYLATPGVWLTATERAALRAQQVAGAATNEVARRAVQRVMPQRLTPGVRVTAVPDLTLDLAVEIGLTPDVSSGVMPVSPYNVVFLASYAIDPFHDKGPAGPPVAVPVLIPETVEAAPSTGSVGGLVTNAEDKRAVEDAIVSFSRGTPVATGEDGRFISPDLEAGPLEITVRKDGFKAKLAETIVESGSMVDLQVVLEPDVKKGKLSLRVVDAGGTALPSAEVTISGPESRTVKTGGDGRFEAELPQGRYELVVNAIDFYRGAATIDVKAKATASTSVQLRPRSKNLIAEAVNDRIRLRRGIGFKGRGAELTDRDKETLAAVIDIMLSRPDIKRIRVEAHVDRSASTSNDEASSRARADSVKAYLVENGIDPSRVEAQGIGSARPIAPNLTQRGRRQNRRVEIYIAK